MVVLLCDMCGKENVGAGGMAYIQSLARRGEEGHWEGWLAVGPICLKLLQIIADRNCWKPEQVEDRLGPGVRDED